MTFVFPEKNASSYLTKDFNKEPNKLIFKAIQTNSTTPIYWYLNTKYLSKTPSIHEVKIAQEKENILLQQLMRLEMKLNKILK